MAAGRPLDEAVLYDSRDLVTHAVCVGMTGSGKTGLCLSLIEEAAIDGVPVIAIDPKGDLGNLLLTFPQLSAREFRPWIDEDEARRKGQTADAFAAAEAERWRAGLAEWGEDGARIERLKSAAEFTIYTPGSRAGVPISILSSFNAPPPAVRADGEAMAERAGQHGDERPLPGRPRRTAAEPRAHARDRPLRGRVGGGTEPRSGHADSAGPDPTLHQSRGRRPRRVLSGEGEVRAGDADQRAAGRPGVCPVDGRRASRPCQPPLHAQGKATGGGLLDRAPGRRRTDVLRVTAAQPDRRLDAWADRNDEPARRDLHGRDPRVLPAGRESAVEGPADDAPQARPRVRARGRARHPESGRPRLQGPRQHGDVVPGAASDRTGQGSHARRSGGRRGRVDGSCRDGSAAVGARQAGVPPP